MITIPIPAWILNHPGEYYLLIIHPDGTTSADGGHASKAGVAKAKVLHESIAIIRPPAGSKYVMIKVDDVPEHKGRVNLNAIDMLNNAERKR